MLPCETQFSLSSTHRSLPFPYKHMSYFCSHVSWGYIMQNEIRAVRLPVKLIRDQVSHPHPVTHFHLAHHPIHLCSVIHRHMTANEHILSHIMPAAVPFSCCSATFFPPSPEGGGYLFPPCFQLDALIFIPLSFLPTLSILLFLSSAGVGRWL